MKYKYDKYEAIGLCLACERPLINNESVVCAKCDEGKKNKPKG
jgi:hypothetical protein